jgi:hypothetical protein
MPTGSSCFEEVGQELPAILAVLLETDLEAATASSNGIAKG